MQADGEFHRVMLARPLAQGGVERVLVVAPRETPRPLRLRQINAILRRFGAERVPFSVGTDDDREPLVVAHGGVDAVRRKRGRAVALGTGVATVKQPVHQWPGRALEGRLALGEVDELPFTSALAVFERRQHGDEGVAGGSGVEVGSVLARLRIVRVAEQRLEPVEAGQRRSVGDQIAPGSLGRAGGGERDHDQSWVDFTQLLPAETQRGHDARRKVLEHHVGLLDQAEIELLAARIAEVNRDRHLAAIESVEGAWIVERG